MTLSAFILLVACRSDDNSRAQIDSSSSGAFERYSYTNEAGTRTYKVYIPSNYDATLQWPLLVDLHGCGSDADEESRWSRFNAMAEEFGLLVAYPEQDPEANGSRCWNWFLPEHQERDAGEPSIIAGITRVVMGQWNIDDRRVYVAGVSAGGAMSNVMAVTYPDLFAAVMIYAGCEYKGTTCTGAVAALPPEVSGELAYQAMGAHARVVPVIVLQGDSDPLVPYPNAELIVQQFLTSDDWADDGTDNGSIEREPSSSVRGQKPDGYSYDIEYFTDERGCLLAEYWLIHGLGHAWSNAESNGSQRDMLLTDSNGPDVSSATVDFFLDHPMPESGRECHEVDPAGQ